MVPGTVWESKVSKPILGFLFSLLIFIGCSTQNSLAKNTTPELVITFYGNDRYEYLQNFIIHMNFDVELIVLDGDLVIKNTTEEIIAEIQKLLQIKIDIISDNILNADTTRTARGGPFIRHILTVTIEKGLAINEDTETRFRYVYDPTHPDAILNGEMRGYVMMSNVDIVTEMTDLLATAYLYGIFAEYARNNYPHISWGKINEP